MGPGPIKKEQGSKPGPFEAPLNPGVDLNDATNPIYLLLTFEGVALIGNCLATGRVRWRAPDEDFLLHSVSRGHFGWFRFCQSCAIGARVFGLDEWGLVKASNQPTRLKAVSESTGDETQGPGVHNPQSDKKKDRRL